MTVFRKEALLTQHAFTRLKLAHAAFVDSYECHIPRGKMPVNRLLFICADDSRRKSAIRDLADGRLLPMRAGHVYFIPCKHMVDLDIAAELRFASLQFNLELFHGLDVFEGRPRCEATKSPSLVEELPRLLERDSEIKTLCRINEIIFSLCALWSPPEGTEMQKRLAKSRKHEKALSHIRNSGDASTTVEELAEIAGMQRDAFSRKFTKDMGLTPKEFLSDSLARKASEMLLEPGVLASDVAKALNFSSIYYFSHFFKKRIGMSPKEFQQHSGGR